MTRHSELNRQTEGVYKNIADQFNPGLRSFLSAGRTYEKSLSNVTVAAKGYFNSLVKLGEMASSSKASQEMGDSLFQMAELHRQIQINMEESVKSLRSELLIPLEQKLDLDLKFLAATVKKLQSEHRLKADVLDKSQAKLKKIRRRSQNSKRPAKYTERETQVLESVSSRQAEYQAFVATSFRAALVEERRRFAFLVDRQCTVTQRFMDYHGKARELLGVKLPAWRSSCSDPSTLPPSAIALLSSIMAGGVTPAVSTATVGGPGGGGGNEGDDDDSTAPPSPTPSATLAAATVAVATAVGAVATVATAAASVAGGDDDTSVIDLVTRAEGSEVKVEEGPPAVVVATETAPPPVPPATSTPKQVVVQEAAATQRPMSDVYSHTMPSRKMMADRPSILPECRVRSGSVRQVKRGGERPRVFALFPHSAPTVAGGVASEVGVASDAAVGVATGEGAGPAGGGGGGGDQALLSFEEGDVVTLLVPEAKGGWHYGEHERTHKRGWFPFAYTQLIVPGTVPVAVGGGSAYALNTEPASPGDKPRPYSIAVSGDFNIDKGINGFNSSSAFLRGANPFASVKLRPTKTNDRSAPAIK